MDREPNSEEKRIANLVIKLLGDERASGECAMNVCELVKDALNTNSLITFRDGV